MRTKKEVKDYTMRHIDIYIYIYTLFDLLISLSRTLTRKIRLHYGKRSPLRDNLLYLIRLS